MKHVVASLTIGACLLLSSAGVVFAVDPHKDAAGVKVATGERSGPNRGPVPMAPGTASGWDVAYLQVTTHRRRHKA